MNSKALSAWLDYKIADWEIKGYNLGCKLVDQFKETRWKKDKTRVKGLTWEDDEAWEIYKRAAKDCRTEIERCKKIKKMADKRTHLYCVYLDAR